MNPANFKEAKNIFTEVKKASKSPKVKVIICPPFPYLGLLAKKNEKVVFLGSQNLSSEEKGPFTGEVSGAMLKSLGIGFSIIGHSERRKKGETSAEISKKVSMALKNGICPILCIGESARDHDGKFFGVIRDQLLASLEGVPKKKISDLIVAYEPVWAISTEGKGAMDIETIRETAIFIRKVLAEFIGNREAQKMKIIYGGSADYKNGASIIKEAFVDGLLVGRESLNPENFKKIILSVS